jgi:hypothetical protein
MDAPRRDALKLQLQAQVKNLAAELRPRLMTGGDASHKARALHRDEAVSEDFDTWTDLLSRRIAVLWVLKTLYVRVLEDQGLLRPIRLRDDTSEISFQQLAPNLGQTAFLRWVFRDLAVVLPELFSPLPAEVLTPSDVASRRLIELWRKTDPDTGELLFSFTGETFDSRLMGDLYQDLDPIVKKRFALLQTPDFVLDFILDLTLTPAIQEFKADVVRVLDPACGSGHFLLAAFRRLVAATSKQHPDWDAETTVKHALKRVVGVDINDYACALSRTRLVMAALEMMGTHELGAARELHPQVFWADGLQQAEDVTQAGIETVVSNTATLSRPEVYRALAPILKEGFHAVVGNPPYITEKDKKRREYHKEKIKKHGRRYASAFRKYSLGCPFTERMFSLCVPNGYVGEITADSFMKREFGAALIEKVFPKHTLTRVVSTSGAYIPGHGTPTVILFGRKTPSGFDPVRVVMGKRGEPGKPADPSQGQVWQSILKGYDIPGYEDEFVSVADVDRQTMHVHPWSIGGGGASELKKSLEIDGNCILGVVDSIGIGTIVGDDDIFIVGERDSIRRKLNHALMYRPLLMGDSVRDWSSWPTGLVTVGSYNEDFHLVSIEKNKIFEKCLWDYREHLGSRAVFSGGTYKDIGRPWYAWHQVTSSRYETPVSIVYGEVATHNHFVLDRGGNIFKQTAPVIKLKSSATEEDHLILLAQLNSSTACFWLKQVCQPKGGDKAGDGARVTGESWEERYAFNSSNVEEFPLVSTADLGLLAFGKALDALGAERVRDCAESVVGAHAASGREALRRELDAWRARDEARLLRMVWLQEELDWLCYHLYGLDTGEDLRGVEGAETLTPGLRPFEIKLAQDEAERTGDEDDEQPTQWFKRHGWEPCEKSECLEEDERRVVEGRMERTAACRELELLEQPIYKRRWYKPEHDKQEKEALQDFFEDRMELWAKGQDATWTSADMARGLALDTAAAAAAAVLKGEGEPDLDALVEARLKKCSVPNNKHHVFTGDGLVKRAAWEETWRQQFLEDEGKPASPQVPPKYDKSDYRKGEYWDLRGKLDVPKERFVMFTEIPHGLSEDERQAVRYGWAGWGARERAKVLLDLDDQLMSASVERELRHGVLYGAWFLAPWIAWEDKEFAEEVRVIVRGEVGEAGVTDEMLARWAEQHPWPPAKKASKGKDSQEKASHPQESLLPGEEPKKRRGRPPKVRS